MHKHRRAAGTMLATALLALPALSLGTATPAAAADTTTPLGLASYADFAVDDAHRQVFISDPEGGTVVVTDYAGQVVKRITGTSGARGLAVSADSGEVYVALTGASAIAEIDTASLTETRRYDTGTGIQPRHLAAGADGTVWMGYDRDGSFGGLGSLTPGTDPAVSLDLTSFWYSAPLLATSKAAPDVLIASNTDLSPATLGSYDVSSGKPVEQALVTNPGDGGCSDNNDLALTPDGQHVVTACGSPYKHQVLRTSDLSFSDAYPTGAYPGSAAVSGSGTVAAGLSSSGSIQIYREGADTALRTYGVGSGNHSLARAGLAWAPEGGTLFAVTVGIYGENPLLHVLQDADKAPSELTLQAPATAPAGNRLTVTGTLTSAEALASGTEVKVERTDANGTKTLGSYPVAADGTFKFTDRPRTAGTVTYTVTYAGDATHLGATATATVQVS
ncbi:hypothetical protein G5C51_20530 [Streptomyces sp. A7024]|uniref:Ig-like domain repeat protein n=1 Tax=Streptomyces coryli TaxID=1128680 RepID=A0A6G4U289_9ACTN|nr:Ig-like domain-containing protein [Streptomyces coryli]NGN66274.1 hypothetical protein [Streptomyces coryli]